MDEIFDLIFYGVSLVIMFLSLPVILGALVLGVVVFFDRKGKENG